MNDNENHNEDNNVLSVPPPPAYEQSVNTVNEISTPVGNGTGISLVPVAPSYMDPLPYPNSSENLSNAPIGVSIINIEQREPPPAYSPEFEAVTTTTDNNNNAPMTVAEARQRSVDNATKGKCMKNLCLVLLVTIILVFMLVAFPEWFFYY